MKVKSVLLLFLCISLLACKSNNPTIESEQGSYVNGRLYYKENPMNPSTDTILCVDNIYIHFNGFDYEYCSYVRGRLSGLKGKLWDCQFHEYSGNCHQWEFIAQEGQYIYPICNEKFISIIDVQTGMVADSIVLNNRTIFPKQNRKEDSDHVTRFYMGDFVSFIGNDHMNPKLITDTITLSGDTIICFDAHNGPFVGNSSLTTSNPNILIE